MTSTTPSTLSEYAEFAETVIEQNPQMNESNTKHKLIDPLITVLGWDFLTDVELEYSVQMGANTKHVDYSLSLDGGPAVFIEAKGCDSNLTTNDRSQLQSYLRQQNVDWGLLTNGETFEIMRRDVRNGDIVLETLESISVTDLHQRTNLLRALSKESIKKGDSERIAIEIQQLQTAKSNLQDSKDELAESITRLVTEESGDIISQRVESHAKEFIDDLIGDIDTESQAQPRLQEQTSEPTEGFWEQAEQNSLVSYDDNEVVFHGETARGSFLSFVQFLFDEGHLSANDLPLKFGRTRYLLNSEPIHSNGDEMRNPKQLNNDVYVETHNSANGLKNQVEKLVEYCR